MFEYERVIKEAFPKKAWAYTVMYHGVAIGIWDGTALCFHPSAEFDWDDVTELRVFDDNGARELRFLRKENGTLVCRDSAFISGDTIPDSIEYLLYGTHAEPAEIDDWTVLTESRGGSLYFPVAINELNFDQINDRNDQVVMWLGIRNFLHFTDDLRLEVSDYSFTGFKSTIDKLEVKL